MEKTEQTFNLGTTPHSRPIISLIYLGSAFLTLGLTFLPGLMLKARPFLRRTDSRGLELKETEPGVYYLRSPLTEPLLKSFTVGFGLSIIIGNIR